MQPLISHLASYAASHFGGAVALRFPGVRELTFTEIDALAGCMAGGLAKLGVARGDRVVLHLPNSWQWLIGYYGALRLGAIVIPANILLSPAEVDFMIADTQAKAVIAPSDRISLLKESAPIVISPQPTQGAVLFDELLDHPARAPVDLQPDDLCAIAYTSGTTGKPKGAMLTHGNIFASVCQTATIHMRTQHDRIYSALPFCHVYGNVVLNACFLTGAQLIAPSRFDAGDALKTIAAEKITLLEGVPTMYHQLLVHPDLDTADLSSLTRGTVGGQTMPLPKLEAIVKRFGCPLLDLWGMTELGGPATSHSPLWPPRLGTVGLPFPGTSVRIVEMDDPQREAAIGTPGELQVRGSLVMRGYWNRPEATREAIDANGWLSTGDIATVDADGYVTIKDRKKDMIITAGYNIYPAELEQILSAHHAVAMVAVIGVADDEKGEIPHAFIVLRRGTACDQAELISHCRQFLASYKMPRQISFVDSLPQTSTGKIARRLLRTSEQPNARAGA